ncbi:MAG: HD domain-containing protein [Thiovulaceae bacterium]|nr:HD domain-containing protein [Sulfurimonadaceae bacterium]
MNNRHNHFFSIPFLKSLFFTQNKWHQHGVLVHTLRVLFYVIKRGHYKFIPAAILHDIGKPFTAFVKDEEDLEFNEYSFTNHEETSYQIIKNWFFLSEYTKNMVRYHYLIRDIKKSKEEDLTRYAKKVEIWDTLDDDFKDDLAEFLICDDLGKGKKRR